jgi:hypothetical protein
VEIPGTLRKISLITDHISLHISGKLLRLPLFNLCISNPHSAPYHTRTHTRHASLFPIVAGMLRGVGGQRCHGDTNLSSDVIGRKKNYGIQN